jgi:hypothetical protein
MNRNPISIEGLSDIGRQIAMRGQSAEWKRRVAALAKEIDELTASERMGVWGFKAALREFGYDVDACLVTLSRRGVDA